MKTNLVTRIAKTTLLATCMFVAFTASAFAKPFTVDALVKQHFEKQFKNATNISWKTTDLFTKVSCTVNNQQTDIFYNNNDEFVGTSVAVYLESLPTNAIQTILKKYSDYTVNNLIRFTDAGGAVSYYAEVVKKDRTIVLKADSEGYVSVYNGDSRP